MPVPKATDDEAIPTKPKPKGPATPGRAAAVKRTPNGTPTKKNTANKPATPASVPARPKPGAKKPEPTLLTDFLLGRPSPNRARRKSLDLVKAEMRQEMVSKVQPPGGVKDRVKQWQKASAAAAVVEDPADAISEPDEILVEVEEESVNEDDRIRIKLRQSRPGREPRRDSKDEADEQVNRARSKSAPRKRVISDSHWMKKDASGRKVKEAEGSPIPKDFLKTTAVNPPFKSKIEDWAKRIETESVVSEVASEPRKSSRRKSRNITSDDGIRVYASRSPSVDDGIRVKPIRKKSHDGIRVKSMQERVNNDGLHVKISKEKLGNDGIRIKPSRDMSNDDGIRIKPSPEPELDGLLTPSRKPKSRRRPNDGSVRARTAQRDSSKKSESSPAGHEDSESDENTHLSDDEHTSWTPSRSQRSKRRARKSGSPAETLAEIPFGNSAFSVLDMPLGAEAGTMKRPKPQRAPSLSAVPKVLRKVYNEGKKIVQDTVEPPRPSFNQPPSIESWLNNTTDPFVDRPKGSKSDLEVPNPSTRGEGCKPDLVDNLTVVSEERGAGDLNSSRRKSYSRKSNEHDFNKKEKEDSSSLDQGKSNDSPLIGTPERASPSSPSGLRRSPATRTISSPVKPARKLPFKDVVLDAFKGESTIYRPRSSPSAISHDDKSLTDRPIDRENKDTGRQSPMDKKSPEPPRLPSPQSHKHTISSENGKPRDRFLPAFNKRIPPTTGGHRLSTIASMETFNTASSITETGTDLSQTTITQTNTASTATASNLSRHRSSRSGPKRRLTKHSDLISMLSLPDSVEPGRGKSIRSARSVRTARSHLGTATIRDLLRELAEDETKYMRELRTLVDGVIPVLLTCVLSKSESAVAAGLFNPDTGDASDTSFTKPIVAMGVSLERLKSLHRRIPLQDTDALITWARSAHKVYEDYLAAWRMGFQDVVVNLAPASRTPSAEQQSLLEGLPRNSAGDVVNSSGERVDVAFLLRRPLVRVKYLAKLTKGINNIRPSDHSSATVALYDDLQIKVRRRQKEEAARLEDQAANNTDATRTRDPRTLAQLENTQIDTSRQVCAKDIFALDFPHSSGQRIECQVEVLLRDKPSDPVDSGDILICKIDAMSRFLLFPPLDKDFVSARAGETAGHVVIMIRGFHASTEWHELLILQTSDFETAAEWIQMLGTIPVPPPLSRYEPNHNQELPPVPSPLPILDTPGRKVLQAEDIDIPIGQRRLVESETTTPGNRFPRRTIPSLKPASSVSDNTSEVVSPVKRQRATRYHVRAGSASPTTVQSHSPKASLSDTQLPLNLDETCQGASSANSHLTSPTLVSGLPHIPKIRKSSTPAATHSPTRRFSAKVPTTPEQESEDFRTEPASVVSDDASTIRSDGAPPPPVHRSPSPANLKKPPILESSTSGTKNRRSSSPLKHEYQPSEGSETSSESSDSEDDLSSFSGSSEDEDEFDDELEAADLPGALPGVSIYGKRISPSGSLYSLPNASLAPSNSASQGPYRSVPSTPNPTNLKKVIAMISSWSDKKGRWEDLHPEPCSIVVSAGLIEAFEMSASHSSESPAFESSGSSEIIDNADAGAERPLVALILTPLVSLRKSTALDIEIQSPPTERSRLKCSGTVRYRALTVIACQDLYQAIHRARLENPVYKKLEQERMLNSYGGQSYEAAVAGNRRRSWFGRQRSYRASARAPSATISEGSNNSHSSSAFSALKRLSGGAIFNIAKSSVDMGAPGGPTSMYTSSSESGTSGFTPPRTPTSPSLSGTAASNAVNLGSENLKIRLYCLETASKWNDIGAARLSVTQPPPGMRQASSLYHGIEKRIIVTRKAAEGDKKNGHDSDRPVILLDVVLGSGCFSKIGRTGIAINVWEDVTGPNGEIGMIGPVGGVSGRTRKWMLQCGSATEAHWIFGLVAVGR
ncbi:glucan 4-alpha-glucosidase [Phlyctema vagabunda]|uniref:Glucan 4-alpha-glucosidase n=1 Tax=Phlyctema vagabunda TaxID=108571 RepID=A0ABR4PN74_9HELO